MEEKHYRVTFHGTIDVMAYSQGGTKNKITDETENEDIIDGIAWDDLKIEEIIP